MSAAGISRSCPSCEHGCRIWKAGEKIGRSDWGGEGEGYGLISMNHFPRSDRRPAWDAWKAAELTCAEVETKVQRGVGGGC